MNLPSDSVGQASIARGFLLVVAILLPSLGVYSAMYAFPDTVLGQSIFSFCKLALLILPLALYFGLDKLSFTDFRRSAFHSPNLRDGLVFNLIVGTLICLGIYLGYRLLGEALIDINTFQQQLDKVGMKDPTKYLLLAAYWTFINALLEEYFWRWFVVRECEKWLSKNLAIVVSAVGFVLHHTLAMLIYFDWKTALLCSLGVFIGGLLWSYSYSKYRSIWPGYLSHILIDAIIFYIGWDLLFS